MTSQTDGGDELFLQTLRLIDDKLRQPHSRLGYQVCLAILM